MRKLAWFAVFFAAAALFVFLFPEEKRTFLWSVPLLILALLGSTFFLRSMPLTVVRFLRTALLGFGIGCLYVLLWHQLTQKEILLLLEREQTVEAVVLEDSTEASNGIRTDIRVGHLRCALYSDSSTYLEAGERIRFRAVFRSSMEKTNSDYYLSLGVPLFAYAGESPEILGRAQAYWRFWPARIGALLREKIRTIYDRQSAAFLLAVLTGDRSSLKQDTWFYSMLRSSGVAHCGAVSGMHLSFLVMFLYVILGRGRLSACFCIPVTLLFMAMTGFSASVMRAGVMQIAVCGARVGRKQYDSLSALGLALIILLLLNPYSIRNAGLILSFASTLGILLFSEEVKSVLPDHPKKWNKHRIGARLWNGVLSSVSISLSSSIFTVPLNALFFRQISLIAPLTNLLVLWAVSLCFCMGLLGILVGLWSLSAASIFRIPVGILVSFIREVTGRVGSLPIASLYIRSPYLPCWIAVSWAAMAAFRFLPGLTHRIRSFILVAGIGLVLFLGLSWLEPALNAYRFCTLDVGQGQCLVFTGPGTTAVIDCGGSLNTNAGDLAAEYLFAQGRFRVNTLILTHFHQDHVNGVTELLLRVPAETLYCPYPDEEDPESSRLLAFAAERGTKIIYVDRDIQWLKQSGAEIAIVPPLNQIKENESGLCVAAKANELSFLCTGDAGMGTERRLLERLQIENVAVLVAGHHGSAGSLSEDLLKAADPGAVVISVGRNSYGLPSVKTLARLRDHGFDVYRTDELGDIMFTQGQGDTLWVNLSWKLFERA